MVYILLSTGFEETEALVPTDLLRRAGIEVRLVGLQGRAVTGGHGITVMADITPDQVCRDQISMVVLPGGEGGVESMRVSDAAKDLILAAYSGGRYLAAICAAPVILAQMHITDGRTVVCYPGLEAEMGTADVRRGQGVVVDGPIITGEAAGAAFEFGLTLVAVMAGDEAARRVRDAVHYRG